VISLFRETRQLQATGDRRELRLPRTTCLAPLGGLPGIRTANTDRIHGRVGIAEGGSCLTYQIDQIRVFGRFNKEGRLT